MSTMTDLNSHNYRYPGSRPFYDTDIDRHLFFGRDSEKESLLHKILTNNLMVLYSKSGLGKTSLINAGVNQALRDRGFIPIMIRFNNPDIEPLKSVYVEIKKIVEQKHPDYEVDYEEGEKDSLWQYFKTVAFWSSKDTSLKPVLIMDQFEEFFILHSSENRESFTLQLADVVKNIIPKVVRDSVSPGETFPYAEKPLNVKIIISIREDYLGQLEEMEQVIPDIFHNHFRLLPLTREKAREAIINPCQVELENKVIHGAPFKFAPEAVDMMLDFLCKQRGHGEIKKTDVVESFQLQLLCQEIEIKVQKKAKKKDEHIVNKSDVGDEAKMNDVLQYFYDKQVWKLDSILARNRAHRLCEKGLISKEGIRLRLEEGYIKRKFKISEDIMRKMVNFRLLRSIADDERIFYELSHDTLIEPLRNSQKKRKREKMLVTGIGIVVGIILIILIFIAF